MFLLSLNGIIIRKENLNTIIMYALTLTIQYDFILRMF